MNENRTPDDEIEVLQGLRVTAPDGAFMSFRRRTRLMQGGKLLFESQVAGFWFVLDTLLRRLFRAVPIEQNIVPQESNGEQA